jgi:hypothetical protein
MLSRSVGIVIQFKVEWFQQLLCVPLADMFFGFGYNDRRAVAFAANLLSPRFDTMLKMLRRNAVPSKASACSGGMN